MSPATPLRNARSLADKMGGHARLVVYHGYGHSSQCDVSDCTEKIGRGFILDGKIPEGVTDCYANRKPYLDR